MTENPYTPEHDPIHSEIPPAIWREADRLAEMGGNDPAAGIAPELLLEDSRRAALATARTRYENACGDIVAARRAVRVGFDRPAAIERLIQAYTDYQSALAALVDAIEQLVDA